MEGKAKTEFEFELLKKKLAELQSLTFPESPDDPFLNNLYLELADYEVNIVRYASGLLENGLRTNKEKFRIDNDWNEKLDTFDPNKNDRIEAYSVLKHHKQILDDFIDCVLQLNDP
jgi:hypothetical protein